MSSGQLSVYVKVVPASGSLTEKDGVPIVVPACKSVKKTD